MNIVIITGASSGLGYEFARQMDSLFHNIDEFWLIARRKDRLEELAATLTVKTRLFPMDITLEAPMMILAELLKREKPCIRVLVNCAGYGILSNFQNTSIEEQCGMVNLNCNALLKVTHACIPYMKKNSRIIQLASSAAFLPQSNFAVYAATKSFVLSFSRALGQELKAQGIIVTAVCPGPVDTEFFQTAEKYGKGMSIKKLTLVSAQNVVGDALSASAEKKSITVYGEYMKAFHVVSKLLPHGLLLHLTRLLH